MEHHFKLPCLVRHNKDFGDSFTILFNNDLCRLLTEALVQSRTMTRRVEKDGYSIQTGGGARNCCTGCLVASYI